MDEKPTQFYALIFCFLDLLIEFAIFVRENIVDVEVLSAFPLESAVNHSTFLDVTFHELDHYSRV